MFGVHSLLSIPYLCCARYDAIGGTVNAIGGTV